MGCGCNRGVGSGNKPGDTIGFYVVLPDKTVLPEGFNPEGYDPANTGLEAPYLSYHEARTQVTLHAKGTVYRLKR